MLRPSLAGLAALAAGCATWPPPKVKSGAIIDQYARAVCVPQAPDGGPHWDRLVEGSGGCTARVVGRVASTGHVGVEYPADKAFETVAAFGEKSNPIDVRFDAGSCRLYVRSYGSPLFVKELPTWLVEYDVRHRRELQTVNVYDEALPPVCPGTRGLGE